MVTGGGGRGWLFLKRNDGYAEARPPFAGGAPSFLDAPFPLRRQTEADLEAARWGLFAWEDPFAAPGPCSPFRSVCCMQHIDQKGGPRRRSGDAARGGDAAQAAHRCTGMPSWRALSTRFSVNWMREPGTSRISVEIGLGAVTVAASLVAGPLGPVAIALYAVVLSVPVWIAWYWLLRRG